MNASCFFPKVDQKTSGLEQCLDSKLPVFSRDMSKVGHKSFFACGYQHFVEHYYRKQKSRNFYEVLQCEKPTKLFFDFDSKSKENPTISYGVFYSFVKKFISKCLKEIETKWNKKNIEVILLDASTDDKNSCHAVFNFFLKDMENVRAFALYLVSECIQNDSEKNIVDTCVYTRNRSFRLVYSSKFGKSNALIPEGSTNNEKYDVDLILKSLIQCGVKKSSSGQYQLITDKSHTFVHPCRKRKREEVNTKTYLQVPPTLAKFFLDNNYSLLSAKKDKENNLFFILKGRRCPWKKDKHKSNNTYMFLNKNGYASFRCADEECPKHYYLNQNLKFALI